MGRSRIVEDQAVEGAVNHVAYGSGHYQGYADHIANRFASAPVQAHQIIYAGYYGGYAE